MPPLPKSFYRRQFIESVRTTITGHDMLSPDDRILIGVSGGMDSVSLLHALLALSPAYGRVIGVYHLNHGLRGKESQRDADFVARLTDPLPVRFHLDESDVKSYRQHAGLSLEEAARRIRYQQMEITAETYGYTKIATAHHADDNAELMLMNLIRGSGSLGLSGIPPVRNGMIVRPLIKLRRAEIAKFIHAANLPFVSDSSNTDLRFSRNKIRHKLLPFLRDEFNPNISATLNRVSGIIGLEEKWIEETISPVFSNLVLRQHKNIIDLDLKELINAHPAVRRRVIRRAIKAVKGDLRRITLAHIDDVIHLAETATSEKRIHLPDRILAGRRGDAVFIENRTHARTRNKPTDTWSINILVTDVDTGAIPVGSGGRVAVLTEIPGSSIPEISKAGQNIAFFDMDKIVFPLKIRKVAHGDRIQPLGMHGTQKIKKFFINEKIPSHLRWESTVLLSAGRIIWIMGHRIADHVKIDTVTKRILKVQISLPNQPE
ncbi:MAG: tRNA lysidine(34) synthetase TilS [Desulfobacteraceae bacterium]|nr:tRNA lysidine(34) synthetase TilS [Desulfobacteraceae bacterium]